MGVEFITKHCRPCDRESMLRGEFKFGTLHEYRSSEGGGFLSDREEGIGNIGIKSLEKPISINIPGEIYIDQLIAGNCGGNAVNFSFNHHNIPVFCASSGKYSADRHLNVIAGNSDYEPNPGATAFVVLDARKFATAMCETFEYICGTRLRVDERNVLYASREKIVSEAEAATSTNSDSRKKFYNRLPYLKPQRFSLEEEVRFVVPFLKGVRGVETVFTKDFPAELRRRLSNSIVDEGSSAPRRA